MRLHFIYNSYKNKNRHMYSEYSRYTKGNALIHIQHQKNHYRQLINPRSTMNTKESKRINHLSLIHNKHTLGMEKKRKEENKRLMDHLQTIEKGKNIFEKIEARTNQGRKQNLTMVSDFKKREEKNEIMNENKKMVNKINHIKPIIGTKNQWKAHEAMFKVMGKKLCKKSFEEEFDPGVILRETISTLSQRSNHSSLTARLKIIEKNSHEEKIKIKKKKDQNSKMIDDNQIFIKKSKDQNVKEMKIEDNQQKNIPN